MQNLFRLLQIIKHLSWRYDKTNSRKMFLVARDKISVFRLLAHIPSDLKERPVIRIEESSIVMERLFVYAEYFDGVNYLLHHSTVEMKFLTLQHICIFFQHFRVKYGNQLLSENVLKDSHRHTGNRFPAQKRGDNDVRIYYHINHDWRLTFRSRLAA